MENLNKQKEKYENILKQNKDITSLLMLGRIYTKELNIKKAMEYYNKVIEIDNLNKEALFVLASFNMKVGNYRSAFIMFKTIEEIGINNNFIYEYLGFLESDNEKKEEYFTKALLLYKEESIGQKEYVRLLENAQKLYALSFHLLALKYVNLAQNFKKSSFISNLIGCIYFNIKDFDKALSYFHDANTKLSQVNSDVLCNIALCYKEKGSNRIAMKYIEKAKALNDKDKFIYFAEGLIYIAEGDKKNASISLEKSLEIDNNYEEAREKLLNLV